MLRKYSPIACCYLGSAWGAAGFSDAHILLHPSPTPPGGRHRSSFSFTCVCVRVRVCTTCPQPLLPEAKESSPTSVLCNSARSGYIFQTHFLFPDQWRCSHHAGKYLWPSAKKEKSKVEAEKVFVGRKRLEIWRLMTKESALPGKQLMSGSLR